MPTPEFLMELDSLSHEEYVRWCVKRFVTDAESAMEFLLIAHRVGMPYLQDKVPALVAGSGNSLPRLLTLAQFMTETPNKNASS